LFLDYLIVIALSALFLPHYLAGALDVPALARSPWEEIVAVSVIALVAAVRLVRRPSLYGLGIVVPALAQNLTPAWARGNDLANTESVELENDADGWMLRRWGSLPRGAFGPV